MATDAGQGPGERAGGCPPTVAFEAELRPCSAGVEASRQTAQTGQTGQTGRARGRLADQMWASATVTLPLGPVTVAHGQ